MRNSLFILLCSPLLVLSFCCFAAEFKPVGESRFEYYFWDVYDAKLATPSGNYEFGQHPARLTLTYLRDFAAKDIIKATNEQWQHLGKDPLVGKYDQQLLALWPDIKEGESLTYVTDKQGQGVFYHNEQKLGGIDDTDFTDSFLAIWLSENTSEPQMRKQLIGAQK